MSFYVYTTPEGEHYRHDTDPFAVTILDDAMMPRCPTFSPAADDYSCVASFRSKLFTMGYWARRDLSLFDLETQELKRTFPYRKLNPLATFDETGSRLLLKSDRQVVLLDVETGEAVRVLGVQALDRLVYAADVNEVIVPSQKKDQLLRISLFTGDVSVVLLPFNATLYDLKPHPFEPRMIAIDRTKGVHCIDRTNWSLVWSVSLKKVLGKDDHMGVGQYCGDGTLFVGAVSGRSENYSLVFNAATGAVVNRLKRNCYGLPYRSTLVRDRATNKNTYQFRTLDLMTDEERTVSLRNDDLAS